MTPGFRNRLGRIDDFDVANLLTSAREAVHDRLGADAREEARRMVERWEAMLGPELQAWAEAGRALGASGSLPPEARTFADRQRFRRSALKRLTRAVVLGKRGRVRRWRFAAAGYRRAVAAFLEHRERRRAAVRREKGMKARDLDAVDFLRYPLIGAELRTRWSRDEPPPGARWRRLQRTRELLQRVEEREEHLARVEARRDGLREEVARWLGDEPPSRLPNPEPPHRAADLLGRLLEERDTRRARRTARRVARHRRASLAGALGHDEDGCPLLSELSQRLGGEGS